MSISKADSYNRLINKYNEDLGNATTEEEQAEIQKKIQYASEMKLLCELEVEYKDNKTEFRKVLNKMLDNNEFQNEQVQYEVRSMLAKDGIHGCNGEHFHVEGLNKDQLGGEKLTTENFTEYLTKFAESHPNDTREYHNEVVKWIARAYNNLNEEDCNKELAIIKEVLKAQGFSESQIKEIFQHTKIVLNEAAGHAVRGDGKKYSECIQKTDNQELHDNLVKHASNRCVFGNNIPALEEVGAAIQDSQRDIDLFNSGLHEHQDPPTIEDLYNRIANSDKFSDTNKTNFTSSLISTANSDQDRVNYANLLSKINNSSILEGLAQGASSVKSSKYQNEYVQTIVSAVKDYPQQTQNIVNSTLVSNASQAVVDNAINTSYGANQSASTSVNDYTPSQSSLKLSGSVSDFVSTSDVNAKSITTPISVSTTNYAQIKQDAAINQTLANQKMKDIAMENVAQVKQKIDESIAEWELKHDLKLTDEVIAEMKEIAASEALEEYIEQNPTRKEIIIQKLSNATSVGEVYDILLSALGSKVHQKFIDNLASNGSLSNIRAFISSKAGNSDVIKQILMKTSSRSLKSELIAMLSDSDVLELLERNVISTLEDIDHKILYEYVANNIYSMTQTNFANFLKYLPFDEREKLIQMRNKAFGITQKDEQPQVLEQDVEIPQSSVDPTQHAQIGITGQNISMSTNPQNGQGGFSLSHQKQNGQEQAPVPETKLASNETKKTLSDGRVITNQGTTFAGISSNAANDEGFRVLDPKQEKMKKEGAPIGMNDEVLTPGSPEWLKKYNRQAPTTAFTMAALEELEEGPNLGSTRVKRGQPIKKKYNTNGFNIRG